MIIEKIEIQIRTPTVQYGYFDHRYTVSIGKDEQNGIDYALRSVHHQHLIAMANIEKDLEMFLDNVS